MKEKWFAAAAAGVLAFSALPMTAFAVDEIDDTEYYLIYETEDASFLYQDISSTAVEIVELFGWNGTSVTFPSKIDGKQVTRIGDSACCGYSGLSEVVLPEGISSISASAFAGCEDLESVVLPKSLVTIGNYAFSDDRALMHISLPKGLVSIGDGAFYGNQFQEISVDAGNTAYCDVDGVLMDRDKKKLICYPGGREDAAYVIPDSVTEIGAGAFEECEWLRDLTLSANITDIAVDALSMTMLDAIYVPETNPVFSDDNGVLFSKDKTELYFCPEAKAGSTYRIPDGVVTVHEAFQFNDTIKTLQIPASVEEIEETFSECTAFQAFQVDENNTFYSSADGVLFDKDQSTLLLCPGSKAGAYQIPDSVKIISGAAFYGCSELTSVTVPENVTSINEGAFDGCSALTTVTLPAGLKSIMERAFYYCDQLQDIYFQGTEAQWDAVSVSTTDNEDLSYAAIHFADGTVREGSYHKGDVDNNGILNATDAAQILSYVARASLDLDTNFTDKQIQAADIDDNGTINSQDAAYLLAYTAQEGAGYPVNWDSILY